MSLKRFPPKTETKSKGVVSFTLENILGNANV